MAHVNSTLYKPFSLYEMQKILEERKKAYSASIAKIEVAILQMENNQTEKAYETLSTAEPEIETLICKHHKSGRPPVQCTSDLTLDEILNKQRLGVAADDIAKRLGVSRATFFRRMKKADFLPGHVLFSELAEL